jgi:hypothetical protein
MIQKSMPDSAEKMKARKYEKELRKLMGRKFVPEQY